MLVPNIDYKVFSFHNLNYIYFSGNGLICKVYDDIRTYDLSKDIFPENYKLINEKNKEFKEICKDLLYAELVRTISVNQYKNVNSLKISLLVSQECNLKCSYCYGDHGTYHKNGLMSVETAINSINKILLYNKIKKVSICFFGGEPLLNFKLIKEVVKYCEHLQVNTDLSFEFDIISNGMLISEEVELFIIEHNINLQISLDGNKDYNDKYRRDSFDSGSYDMVIQKTALLRKKGVLSVRATLMPNNMDFCSIYEHLYSLNFKKIYISPAFNFFNKKEDYEKLTEQYILWLCQMENSINKGEYKFVISNFNLISFLSKLDQAFARTTFCGATKNLIAVDIHGKMYPCHRFVNFDSLGMESIEKLKYTNKQIVHRVNNERNEKCKNCWALNLCVSGCIYNNFVESGMFSGINLYYCKYFKTVAEKIIYIYITLKEDEQLND